MDKMNEVNVMRGIRHPYISRFKYQFSENNKLCIINEYCDRGDLEIYMKNQNRLGMSDMRIKRFIVELLLAIDFLH